MIIEIDTGSGYVPLACLTKFNEAEAVETIGTTTRDTNGWRDGFTTVQSKVITGDGLIPTGAGYFTYTDVITLKRNRTEFNWRIDDDDGVGFFSAVDLKVTPGEDVVFSFTIEVVGEPSPAPDPLLPTIAISGPVPSSVETGNSVDYTVTYGNADTVTLSAADVNVFTTGSVVASDVVTGTGNVTRTVTVTATSGTGTLYITINAGTASNVDGNAPGAGPSNSATITALPPPPPSGYTLAWDNNPILSTTPGLTLSNGNGQGVSITGVITSSGGGSPVNVNESFGSTPFNFTVDVSTLPNGTLSANITVLDGVGGTQTILPAPTTTKNL